MADTRHYARPPITEAVIELRFEGALDGRDLERVRDRFKQRYSTVEQLQVFEVLFEGGAAKPTVASAGFKLTDKNAVDVLMVQPISLGTIRLAPYESWESLRRRAQENWELFERLLKTRKRVTRIGARFINRIDIPGEYLSSRDIKDFFPTHVHIAPGIASRMGGYAFNVAALHASTGAKLTIQSATLQPPALLEHASISLDTDAYWDEEIPQRVDEIWAKADKLREAKNDVFEHSITNLIRDLFK